jgi:hypothetical protein
MPSDKPFFTNLPEVKKVITPSGEVLVRKTCKCGQKRHVLSSRAKSWLVLFEFPACVDNFLLLALE